MTRETTAPVGAVIAHAIFDGTGCQFKELPVTVEPMYEALKAGQ